MIEPSRRIARRAWSGGRFVEGTRAVPAEVPVALTYNRASFAVMLATPADLEDFAVGFSLTEGLIDRAGDVEQLEIVEAEGGIEARIWLPPALAERFTERRRALAGPVGCGLCGIESLAEASRPPRPVTSSLTLTPEAVVAAVAALGPAQRLNAETRAVHGAGFWSETAGLVALREDVGRHNALDKLAGALAARGVAAAGGIILMTSRLSVELVQKAAMLNAPVLAAVSAPTGRAIDAAEAAGITLVAVARGAEFEVFTRAERIVPKRSADVA